MRLSLLKPVCTHMDSSCESMLEELGAHLFGSLQRSGQRLKAERYVRGLLTVPGRKTLRNIAAQFEGGAAQQSVHHFISESPWEWMPVRHALAQYVQRNLAPDAWVVRSTLIPKVGSHSIGVDQHSLPHMGQTVTGQQAVGAWLASGRSAVPIDWRLRLSGRWLSSPRRQRAGIPAGVTADSLDDCVREAVSAITGIPEVQHGPVVVDVDGIDAPALARHLASAGIPFVVRVDPQEQLRIDRSELPKYGDRVRTAAELASSLISLRQQVNTGERPVTAVAIPVTPAEPAAAGGGGMTLVGEWRKTVARPGKLWLAGGGLQSMRQVLWLTVLPHVVARDFNAISDKVGIRDFAGRSFPGWHRHVTLASAAHLAVALESSAALPAVQSAARW
ncbi:IS701 family transposase [Streptomyces sp. NPDC048581]|uniref:IS701 family transposase n=1 Tax=unclassified Streptomyces TaxID=2593676 RepID=UPI0037142837